METNSDNQHLVKAISENASRLNAATTCGTFAILTLLVVVLTITTTLISIIKYKRSIPCDHGDLCELNALKTWWYKPSHSPSQYCVLHKMYHHQQRNCMLNKEAVKQEEAMIKARELDIGYRELVLPIIKRADTPIKVPGSNTK